jgi:hypothetical protein
VDLLLGLAAAIQTGDPHLGFGNECDPSTFRRDRGGVALAEQFCFSPLQLYRPNSLFDTLRQSSGIQMC